MGKKTEFGEEMKWPLRGSTFLSRRATDPQVKYTSVAWLASIQAF